MRNVTWRNAVKNVSFDVLPGEVLALGGLWAGRRRLESWMLAAPLIGLTAVHIAFFSASPRFTIPMEPAAIVLAAFAVQCIVKPAR